MDSSGLLLTSPAPEFWWPIRTGTGEGGGTSFATDSGSGGNPGATGPAAALLPAGDGSETGSESGLTCSSGSFMEAVALPTSVPWLAVTPEFDADANGPLMDRTAETTATTDTTASPAYRTCDTCGRGDRSLRSS